MGLVECVAQCMVIHIFFLYLVEILDETRVSLSGKGERLTYIDIPRRNTSESRDEIISTRSKETKENCTSAGKVKG